MIVEINPSKVSGSITPPSSKSFLHRAIISAALADGTSTISNVVLNDDVLATLEALTKMGMTYSLNNSLLTISSRGLTRITDDLVVDCNESGSTMRFLIPLLSNNRKVYFKGKSSLLNRPYHVYKEIYNNQNLMFEITPDYIITQGKILPGKYIVSGSISSQFITGLLFTLSVLDGDSTVEVVDNFESEEYVDLTLQVMSEFGVIVTKNENSFFIKGNQKYIPTNINCESDFSQAAFFAVLGIVNNDLNIMGLPPKSHQPDKVILSYIKSMGGAVLNKESYCTLKKSSTRGIDIDISQSPDIGPIISLLGACSEGTTRILNASRLRIKESNRLASTFDVLSKFGVDVTMEEDSLIIQGTNHLSGGVFDTHNDHRIAMTIAIGATIADGPVTITNAEVVNKSYPGFYKDLQSLGADIKYR